GCFWQRGCDLYHCAPPTIGDKMALSKIAAFATSPVPRRPRTSKDRKMAASAPLDQAWGYPLFEAQAEAPKQQPQQQSQPPQPAQIDRNGVLILIRSALLALDQANKTGNYTSCAISVRPIFRPIPRHGLPKSSPSSARTMSTCPASPSSTRS